MTKEQILERLIEKEISGENANRLLRNLFLYFSWLELLLMKEDPDFYELYKDIFDYFRGDSELVRKVLKLTDSMARDGVSLKTEKANKDNILFFPPFGIKQGGR